MALLTDRTGNILTGAVIPAVSITAAAAANTLTIAAAGAGLFHYITSIRIMRTTAAALAGSAVLAITSTNTGGLAWTVGNAVAAGATQIDIADSFDNPLKTTAANTATTIICPAPGAGVIWTIVVTYYIAP